MRRKEKEITDTAVLRGIITQAKVCRLAMIHDNRPYLVPLSFGFQANCLYFHGAPEGKKITCLRHNPEVCFEFDQFLEVTESDKPCNWGMRYQSVIGFGQALFVEDMEEKREALQIIMAHYGEGEFHFPDAALRVTTVIKLPIESMSGKQST